MIKKVILIIGLLNFLTFLLVFKKPVKKQRYRRYDCAVICGYPADNNGVPSKIMASRVMTGVKLYKEHKVKKLIMAGGAVKNKYVEAEVMADHAVSLGVKREDIIIEGRSRSTYHNLRYCHELMAVHGLKTALVVTNSWHLRKADHYARKFNLDYAMIKAQAPKSYSKIKIIYLHLATNVMMYRNLFKGYY